jgi:DNA-binding NarL/FixJ family response regulator
MQKKNSKNSKNILIVEDSSFYAKWQYAEFLNIDDVKIVGFSDNTIDAFLMLQNHDTDIVITDIRLKEGLTTKFIDHIKSRYENIVVIVFSNYTELREECLRLGTDYFFNKSNEFDELFKVISKLKI